MNYVLTKEQLQALLNYLGTRPYIEVAKLIATLSQLKPDDSKKDDSAKTKK